MRIIFLGTPDFAVPSLETLIQSEYHVVGVVTAPDKPAGRGLQMKSSPVKECALRNDIPVLQPEKLRDPEFQEQLKALKADIDEAAWSELYSTTSRPFANRTTGKIAVKGINHYGDEVLHVYPVK
jgi:hypothetical protein